MYSGKRLPSWGVILNVARIEERVCHWSTFAVLISAIYARFSAKHTQLRVGCHGGGEDMRNAEETGLAEETEMMEETG
jgi:hypothetical protein